MPPTTTPRRASRRAAGAAELRYVQTLGYFANRAGLTIEALADQSGISRDQVAAMIRGRRPVTAEDALLLGRVLGVAPEELRSGPPSTQVSGAALLDGSARTKADVAMARYQLGLEDHPPAAPMSGLRAGGGDTDDQPDRPWRGSTTWGELFGGQKCGWCWETHEAVSCRF